MYLAEALRPLADELYWILCLAFVVAFLLAFSVGANDVSNSFGTSVGSRVLTVTQACILATIFEVAGACLLGYSVCDTFRKKMYKVEEYEGAQRELLLGALACLLGSALWNLLATALKMPISGTHSIVGATIGFSVVLRGWSSGIQWNEMARIVASWFASPLLSGMISALIYTLISKTIIRKIDPLRHGLKALPLFYGVTIFINVASITINGPDVMGINLLPWYSGLFIALLVASITICLVAMILVPKLKNQILDELVERRSGRPALRVLRKAPPPPGPAGGGGHVGKTKLELRAAYDNVTFQADLEPAAGEKAAGAAAGEPTPSKPRRELALDAGKLAETAAKPAGERPQVAPKPMHLKRQLARSESAQPGQQLEEIDLSGGDAEPQAKEAAPAKFYSNNNGNGNYEAKIFTDTGERYEIARLFGSLQILTACFASFAHGTNDVSNAVAPLVPIWNIYSTGQEDISNRTQVWILAFGSIGICTGLWAWGRAVMSTISDGLTKITPSKGFAIELGAAISVLCATKLGLPISTTHCKVGSLVTVGFVSSKFLAQDHMLYQRPTQPRLAAPGGDLEGAAVGSKLEIWEAEGAEEAVDWRMFGNIALTWVSTVPSAALASAAVMYVLKWLLI